jgi:hypothetical protein
VVTVQYHAAMASAAAASWSTSSSGTRTRFPSRPLQPARTVMGSRAVEKRQTLLKAIPVSTEGVLVPTAFSP